MHRARPRLAARFPVHVTMRVTEGTYGLRSRRCFRAVERALLGARGRFGTFVTHFSVQGNHMHLIVESLDEAALMAAMKGLGVRVAKALNRVMGRKGQVIAERYHAHYLRTPTEVRHAVSYVLHNHTKHFGRAGRDPYGSGAHPGLVEAPRTWLLRIHAPPG